MFVAKYVCLTVQLTLMSSALNLRPPLVLPRRQQMRDGRISNLDAADHNVGKKTRHFYCCLAVEVWRFFFQPSGLKSERCSLAVLINASFGPAKEIAAQVTPSPIGSVGKGTTPRVKEFPDFLEGDIENDIASRLQPQFPCRCTNGSQAEIYRHSSR